MGRVKCVHAACMMGMGNRYCLCYRLVSVTLSKCKHYYLCYRLVSVTAFRCSRSE